MHHDQPCAKRNLTPLYCLHQAAYFFAMSGISAFAVTYLMGRGFDTALIGVMLAMSNILSCVLQPSIGSYVDRTSYARLQVIVPGCLIASFVMLGSIELLPLPQPLVGMFYILGSLAFSITLPLCNSLCAYYSRKGIHVNYGAGSGIGSLSFSFGSLGFGYIMAHLGISAMILIVLLFLCIQFTLVMRYPRIDPNERSAGAENTADSLSLLTFALRYKFFMLTMFGLVLISACHAMAENFLIHVFTDIGGGSEHVGVCLFLACITAAPAQICFERIQRRVSIVTLLRLTGVFYIAKAILLIFASSVTSVYLIGLLQTVTYGFLYPPLYYLVLQRIAAKDMAKGQTLASSTFVLGLALGNSLGGVLLERLGLDPMLAIAAAIACAGTLLVNIAVGRKDIQA